MVNSLRQLVFLTCLTAFSQQQALAQRVVYKDGASTINGNWNGTLGAGSVAQITTDAPYEGGQHYRFNYDFGVGYFDGFGLQFYSGANFSGKTYLRLAFRGSGADHKFQIRLADAAATSGFVDVTTSLSSTTYATANIPMSSFTGVNLSAITSIQLNTAPNGAAGGTGTVFFDAIELINDPAVLVTSRVIYKDGATTINGNWNGTLGAGSVAQTATNTPFDGTEHYRFNYDFGVGYFDGFGLQFYAGANFSGKTYLQMAYKGMSVDQKLQIRLSDGTNTTGFYDVGTASPTYQVVSIPIATLVGSSGVNLNAVTSIQINTAATGAAGGTGTVYLDAFELTNIALSVELLSFKATPLSKTVQLDWKTASEKNASHFDVERSNDGKTFVVIGNIKANGNSSTLQNYTFDDENPLNGLTYYRLRQVDFDGTTAFSPIVNVSRNGKSKFVFAPNPAKDNIVIHLEGNEKQVILTLYDLLGKVILTKNIEGNSSNLDISALPSSTYLLEIRSNGQVFREKMVKY